MLTLEQRLILNTPNEEIHKIAHLYPGMQNSIHERINFILENFDTPLEPQDLKHPNPLLLAMKEDYHSKIACRVFHLEIQRVNALLENSPKLYNECVGYIAGLVLDLQMEWDEYFPIAVWFDSPPDPKNLYSSIKKTENSRPPSGGKFVSADTEVQMVSLPMCWKASTSTRENILCDTGFYQLQVKINHGVTTKMMKEVN